MRQFYEHDFPKLLDLLYEAALDRSRWQAFLDVLSKSFGGANGVLYEVTERGIGDFSYAFGGDTAFLTSYLAHYHKLNPYVPAVLGLPLGSVLPATQAVSAEVLCKSEFYNDWMRPQGIPADHLGALLRRDEAGGVVLGVAPHSSVYSRKKEQYHSQLELLAPHIARALELNRTMASAAEWRRGAENALSFTKVPAFLLAQNGRVLVTNAPADELMRIDRIVQTTQSGTLCASSPTDDSRLQVAIRAGLRRHHFGPVRIESGQRSYIAWVLPNSSNEANSNGVSASFGDSRRVGAALVLIIPFQRFVKLQADAISAAFGLTGAEARLTSALVGGYSLSEYSQLSGVAHNTLRNQLATVFLKTGTSRQTELVALVINTLAPAVR